MAKRPRRGRVKTRLVPPLRPGQALELYRALLGDTLRLVQACAPGRSVELCLDGPATLDRGDPAPFAGLRLTAQGSGDLGRRLARAFARSRAEGATSTVIIGADSPTLPAERITRAFALLRDGAPVVLAPADDGGYVLIGLREPIEALFVGVPWGGPDVATCTVAKAAALGLRVALLEAWYDVDDRQGLARLRRELRRQPGRAPTTARYLNGLGGPGD